MKSDTVILDSASDQIVTHPVEELERKWLSANSATSDHHLVLAYIPYRPKVLQTLLATGATLERLWFTSGVSTLFVQFDNSYTMPDLIRGQALSDCVQFGLLAARAFPNFAFTAASDSDDVLGISELMTTLEEGPYKDGTYRLHASLAYDVTEIHK